MEFDLIRKKKMSSATAIAYLVFLLVFVLLISSYRSSLQRIDLHDRLSIRDQDRPLILLEATDSGPPLSKPPPAAVTCDRSHYRYDLCKINGQAVLDPTTATLYATAPSGPTISVEKVKPHPRKFERSVMEGIREFSLKSGPIAPRCGVNHNSPAVVFAAGGYTGNFFHDIGDGFLPLFITVNTLSLADRDVILVVDQAQDWWVHKYADVIRAFTKHPIINLQNDTSTHCFKWAAVGLISHGFMSMDPKGQPGPLSMAHFHSFVRNVYEREGHHQYHSPETPPKGKPRLVWLSRAGAKGRIMVNHGEARAIAEEVGFDVIVYKPTKKQSLRKAYGLINGSHAMIGVHGAAMTHLFFLRPGAVVVQLVPLGLEWGGEVCYGMPSRDVGMDYMVYKVGMNESTLMRKYKKEDPILKDPEGKTNTKEWVGEVMDVYLREQNVKLDLVRFRGYMESVYEKAKLFMKLNG